MDIHVPWSMGASVAPTAVSNWICVAGTAPSVTKETASLSAFPIAFMSETRIGSDGLGGAPTAAVIFASVTSRSAPITSSEEVSAGLVSTSTSTFVGCATFSSFLANFSLGSMMAPTCC
jgi:hypothetical protein